MKAQQLSLICLVSLVFSCLIPYLAATQQQVQSTDSGAGAADTGAGGAGGTTTPGTTTPGTTTPGTTTPAASTTPGATTAGATLKTTPTTTAAAAAKIAGPFLTKEVKLPIKEVINEWNSKHAAQKIATDALSTHSLTFANLAELQGAPFDAKKFIELRAKDADAAKLGALKTEFEGFAKAAADHPVPAEIVKALNELLGYTGSVKIYFPAADKGPVEAELKKTLVAGVFGLTGITEDKASFEAAVKAVYKEGKDLYFDKVTVKPESTNLANFIAHLAALKKEAITDAEAADAKLKALKSAIDAYNGGKTDENLENVKQALLKYLQGEASTGSNGKKGLETWMIIVIVVGVAVALIGAGAGIFYFLKKGKSSQ